MKIRRARLTALLVAVLGGGLAAYSGRSDAPSGPPSETLRLEVDLSERSLSVLERGQVVEVHPVTVGSADHPTPTGTFRIDRVVWNPDWNPPDSEWAEGRERMPPGSDNPMGRAKMFFRQPAYYIHGTRDVWDLGKAASHGCVRMSNGDVLDLAKLVMAHGGEPREPGWFRRVINRFTDTREVTLSRPVVLVVRS
jgi:murein L,D-transpeptidase YcbB/YkuD